jgi:mannose-6-phosphate isomerase-like protein (cupin superfamily)
MNGFHTNVEKETGKNKDYRRVLFTGPNAQLVLMSLKPKEDIGKEKHNDKDQFIRIEEGSGEADISGKKYKLVPGDAVVIPSGAEHNIIASDKGLKIYTIYTSQDHPDGTVERTKADAEKEEGKENKYDMEKSLDRSKLVPKKIMVSVGGRTYQTTKWVRPDAKTPKTGVPINSLSYLQSKHDQSRKNVDGTKKEYDSFLRDMENKYGAGRDEKHHLIYLQKMSEEEHNKLHEVYNKWMESGNEYSEIAAELQKEKDKQKEKEPEKSEEEQIEEDIKKYDINKKTFNEMSDYLEKHGDDYNFIAVRGDDKSVKVGEKLKPSIDMSRMVERGTKLSGTSAFAITPDSKLAIQKQLIQYFKTYSQYDHYSILTGSGYDYGDDPREFVVENPVVLATWDTWKNWGKSLLLKSLTYSGHKLQGRTNFKGLDISIENKKGSVRRGVDKDGHNWATKMHYDYGYARKTEGKDGDFLDIYLGPDKESEKVYIVHQNDPATGKYDEDKCMLGFGSAAEAKQAYLKQYDRPGFFGSMEETDIDIFRRKAMEDKNKGKKLSIEKAIEMIKDILHKALPPKPENIEDTNAHKTPPEGYPEQKKEYGSPNEYKYPLDTEEHVRAALAYFSKPKNYGMYSEDERKAIWGRIVKAAKKIGIVVDMEHKFSDEKETEKSIRLVVPVMKKSIAGYSSHKYMMGCEDGNVLEANVFVK